MFKSNFCDPKTSTVLKVAEKTSLLEWFAKEYQNYGCKLEFVTDKSKEGAECYIGYGGIGGILRYPLDMRWFDELSDEEAFEQIPDNHSQ